MEGKIWLLTRSLQLASFQAYKLRVTHLYQLKQHSILVSVGQDEHGINPLVSVKSSSPPKTQSSCFHYHYTESVFIPQVKVWNLDKRDSGNPLCTRIFPAIPGNKPTEVSCLSVHENLNFMAIGKTQGKVCSLYVAPGITVYHSNTQCFSTGFTDGSVVLTKGDITRDRHSKTLTLHEGTIPVTGLAFRQVAKVTHLFVATLEKVHVSVEEHIGCMEKTFPLYSSLTFIFN